MSFQPLIFFYFKIVVTPNMKEKGRMIGKLREYEMNKTTEIDFICLRAVFST